MPIHAPESMRMELGRVVPPARATVVDVSPARYRGPPSASRTASAPTVIAAIIPARPTAVFSLPRPIASTGPGS